MTKNPPKCYALRDSIDAVAYTLTYRLRRVVMTHNPRFVVPFQRVHKYVKWVQRPEDGSPVPLAALKIQNPEDWEYQLQGATVFALVTPSMVRVSFKSRGQNAQSD